MSFSLGVVWDSGLEDRRVQREETAEVTVEGLAVMTAVKTAWRADLRWWPGSLLVMRASTICFTDDEGEEEEEVEEHGKPSPLLLLPLLLSLLLLS